MTKITTLSKFYFGTVVGLLNRSLDFDEGAGVIQAALNVGDYSLSELAIELQRALRVAGTQDYLVSVDRVTRKVTITAPNPFDILASTGPNSGSSAWPMLGWADTADYMGANIYVAPDACGSEYITQYPVDLYKAPEHGLRKEQATVNSTATGVVQQISFNDTRTIEMNIRVITDRLGLKNLPFFENPNGVSDFMAFIEFCLRKNKMEFMPDKDVVGAFHICYLERTADSTTATVFELKNMGVPDFYESGLLTFRKVGV